VTVRDGYAAWSRLYDEQMDKPASLAMAWGRI